MESVIRITDYVCEKSLYRNRGGWNSYAAKKPMNKPKNEFSPTEIPIMLLEKLPLWQLGHNLEARGREEVNRLLAAGWRLLHVYTLKYEEDGVWRERPTGILGRPRNAQAHDCEQIGPLRKHSSLI
jgi:hypothetical protein